MIHNTIVHVSKLNPDVSYDVFIHKVEGLSDDYKLGMLRNLYRMHQAFIVILI